MTDLSKRGPAKKRGEYGSSLVEHALVLTLLLTVLFAIIDFGRALYTYHFVSNAAREATRWASVRGTACRGLPNGCPADPDDVQAFVSNVAGMGLDPAKITADTNWVAPPNASPTCDPGLGGDKKNPGCVVEVTVKYSYSFFFPFLPASPIMMQSTSRMVISQ